MRGNKSVVSAGAAPVPRDVGCVTPRRCSVLRSLLPPSLCLTRCWHCVSGPLPVFSGRWGLCCRRLVWSRDETTTEVLASLQDKLAHVERTADTDRKEAQVFAGDVAAARMAMLDAGGGGATAGGASSMRAHVSGSAGGDRGMFAGLTGLLNAFSSGGPGDSDGGFRR